jgi:hypothetical protein
MRHDAGRVIAVLTIDENDAATFELAFARAADAELVTVATTTFRGRAGVGTAIDGPADMQPIARAFFQAADAAAEEIAHAFRAMTAAVHADLRDRWEA